MPSNHLILCRPLLLLSPIPPSIRVFSNQSTLRMLPYSKRNEQSRDKALPHLSDLTYVGPEYCSFPMCTWEMPMHSSPWIAHQPEGLSWVPSHIQAIFQPSGQTPYCGFVTWMRNTVLIINALGFQSNCTTRPSWQQAVLYASVSNIIYLSTC